MYIVDLDGSSLKAVDKGAERYGEGKSAYVQFGRGEFIGNKKDGRDREQGDSARRVYESVIDESPVQAATGIWRDIHNRWGAGTSVAESASPQEGTNTQKKRDELWDGSHDRFG